MHLAVQLCGWAAAICTVLSGVPQVVKLLRTHDSEGVSSWTYLFWTLTALWWALWGIAIGAIPTWAVNVACIPILGAAFFLLKPTRTQLVVLVANIVAFPFILLAPRFWQAVIGSIYQAVLAVPSVRLAIRPHADLSGVAIGTWVLAVASNTLWILFDIGIGYPLTATVGVIALLMSLVIIVRTHQYNRAHPHGHAPAIEPTPPAE